MRKRRPAIVMSPPLPDRDKLCTIVPLSTTRPRALQPFNLELVLDPPLPFPYDDSVMWVKADMILTVAFHRLTLLTTRERDADGARIYDERVLGGEIVAQIRSCMMVALGIEA